MIYHYQVGISYDTGKLEVLPPGLHIRTSPTFRFQEFVSVQEQVRRLEPLKVNTNDGIAIMVKAIITYRIEDPVRAYRVRALSKLIDHRLLLLDLMASSSWSVPGREQRD